MNSSEAAEEIVKLSLEGVEVAARVTGVGAKNIAVLLFTMTKGKHKTKGKTRLNNMLKSGSPLKIFSVKENEFKKFHEEAKKYGVLYTALINKRKPDKDGVIDIMVRADDAPKINRIVERFKLLDIGSIESEIEKDKIDELMNEAEMKGIKVKAKEEEIVENLLSNPTLKETEIINDLLLPTELKEDNSISNPFLAKAEKNPLSEPSSKNKNNLGVVSKRKKPSVRNLLKKIKEEMKQKDRQMESKNIKGKVENETVVKKNKVKKHTKKRGER